MPIALICIPTSFSRTSDYYPSPLNLLWAIIPFSLIYTSRKLLIEDLFPKFGRKFIVMNPTWSKEVQDFRVQRFGIVSFKMIYFFISTMLGVVLFRNEDWMPSYLFGKGKQDLSLIWENYPDQEQPPLITFYYCWELGYHFHSLVYHIQSERRNDYFENLLHHVSTIFLVIFSFINNYVRIGTLVLILHDVGDFAMYTAKSLHDMPNDKPAMFAFVGIVYTFLRFRLVTLGGFIIPAAFQGRFCVPDHTAGAWTVYSLLTGLLCVLLILHTYWFYLVLQMIFGFFKSRGTFTDPHTIGVDSHTTVK
ncbi:longevity assurance factor, putative [Entamoeba invadens IP1]|uniref:Longevity assurance factor, putative n=1 Tax=Entamoeba invadens IP1 TaxID=370355 RepID=A0A0A1U7Z0_ENTIV|nr:longevity assurance factor, putative [Entamoeba invadens IP1]ELP88078.1 longevity assurance factor, putative [Entamoeba invadens IP1]|eukprot:XP_004254849.1 longevity assurance factor, putative [Entamoeba invadens IP1]